MNKEHQPCLSYQSRNTNDTRMNVTTTSSESPMSLLSSILQTLTKCQQICKLTLTVFINYLSLQIWSLLDSYKTSIINPPADQFKKQQISYSVRAGSRIMSTRTNELTIMIPETCFLFSQQSKQHSIIVCVDEVGAPVTVVQSHRPKLDIYWRRRKLNRSIGHQDSIRMLSQQNRHHMDKG